MSRTLVWTIPKPEQAAAFIGPVYRLDQEYVVRSAWAHTKTASTTMACHIDILADGVSMLGSALAIPKLSVIGETIDIATKYPLEGQYISVDLTQAADNGDITVGLELE